LLQLLNRVEELPVINFRPLALLLIVKHKLTLVLIVNVKKLCFVHRLGLLMCELIYVFPNDVPFRVTVDLFRREKLGQLKQPLHDGPQTSDAILVVFDELLACGHNLTDLGMISSL
jgi:hypothetical protein